MLYGPSFFAGVDATARDAAEAVLPLVLDLLAPRSLVDVGCGPGTWLAEAERLGVQDYLGIDGYTPAEALRIAPERFRVHDLTTPLRLDRRFDLAICLEVAEHLEAAAADVLVESLVALAPAVLFSAAVPQQGGDHHVNEQWPDYWVERFAAHGLVAIDAIRPVVWDREEVPWWYRQNILLFCAPDQVERSPKLRAWRDSTRSRQLAVVHPVLHSWLVHQRDVLAEEVARQPSLREVLAMLRPAVGAAVRRRLGKGAASDRPVD